MRKNELIVTIVILAFFINFFFTGPIAIGLPILIKDVYKSDVLGLATVESSMGIGALVGTIILVIYQLKRDRKSTRLNSSHVAISYAVFCLKKKKTKYRKMISLNSRDKVI